MAAADEWNGFEDGDVEMDFVGVKFNVHRAIIAHASPVWKAMLTGKFTESSGNTVHFDGDDPRVTRLCFEMIYSTFPDSTLDWAGIESRVMSDRAALDEFVDKYDLRGVKRLVEYELLTRQETRELKDGHQQFVDELEMGYLGKTERLRGEEGRLRREVKRLEREVKYLATTPGTPVSINDHAPEIGTRVKWMVPPQTCMSMKQWYKYNAVGTIIAIDGRSVTVRWKKGGGVRSYDPVRVGLGYA